MLRRLTFFTFAIFAMLTSIAHAFETSAKSAFVYDITTGTVMFEKNADTPLPPASMSKLMTTEILFKALKDGAVGMETEFGVSEKAWSMGGSKMFVNVNTRVSVEDLIQGIIVQSGNDACVVVAEGLAGTEGKFAELMNARAKELGLDNSSFGNSSGWPHPKQLMSMRDLGKLAIHLMEAYPEYYHYFAQTSFTYGGIEQNNRNPLLSLGIGADGLKTGHTEEAGYGLVGSLERSGRRIVFVLGGMTSMEERAREAENVANWALGTYQLEKVAQSGTPLFYADTWMGDKDKLPLVTKDDLAYLKPLAGGQPAKMDVQFESPLIAPIAKGDLVGNVVITPSDLPPYELPLYAGDDLARGGFVDRYTENLGYGFQTVLTRILGNGDKETVENDAQ